MPNSKLLLAFLSLILLLPSFLWVGCRVESAPRPNLVLVTLDTLRWDHWEQEEGGQAGPTPHLDALTSGGLAFERAFTPMPTTAPAHASILTGLEPHEHGVEKNGDRVRAGIAGTSLGAKLRAAGYRTGAFVTSVAFGQGMGLAEGFDRWDEGAHSDFRAGSLAARAALDWIDESAQPFFVWLHLYDAHSPYGSAAQKEENYPVDRAAYGWVEAARYAGPEPRQRMARLYKQGVSDADAALGQLLSGLETRGLAPFVVVTSDHGEFLDERLDAQGFAYGHGAILGLEVLRVPLVLAGPGIAPGRVKTAVSLRDLYPTLLGFAGLADTETAARTRFDLRGPIPNARILTASRRVFDDPIELERLIDAQALEAIDANEVAATDGEKLLVLGANGALHSTHDDAELRRAANATLRATRASRSSRKTDALDPEDPELRQRLEALGYLE